MTAPIHATAVAIGGRAVLIRGASGSGKSDLAIRLIDRGAMLISDDYTALRAEDGRVIAAPPERIAGRIELRGVGIVEHPYLADIPVGLLIDLDGTPERLPEPGTLLLCGIAVPVIALAGLEPSAPIKVEAALQKFGTP